MFDSQFQHLHQLIQGLINENQQLKQQVDDTRAQLETLELKTLENEEQQQQVQAHLQQLLQLFGHSAR
ncbi:hypothetical protein [Rheinheimera sp.]|uniref:hypothetical protein n=1 Tax=Rheinheimera sp. TaxID=1869214 RepID=UPI00307E61E9